MSKPVDLGEVCVHCRESVAYGSGKFVNRYPVFGLENDGIEYDGYCCDECEQQWINDNPEIVEQLNEHE